VILCGSRKPAPNYNRHSAARELLRPVQAGLDNAGCPSITLDMRDLDLPQFDGRDRAEYHASDLDLVHKHLTDAQVLIVSVPAYWNSVSGPLVNLFNLIGGAAYDHDPDRLPPLNGLIAITVTVGADESSAYLAAGQMRGILSSMGAWIAPREVIVGNPRAIPNMGRIVRQLRELGQYAADCTRP
jgi:NAD(P)H-dependent FMN reductase